MSIEGDLADDSWTRYKIDKPSFLKRYEVFFDSIGKNPSNPKVDGDTLRWLPLLFIVVSDWPSRADLSLQSQRSQLRMSSYLLQTKQRGLGGSTVQRGPRWSTPKLYKETISTSSLRAY